MVVVNGLTQLAPLINPPVSPPLQVLAVAVKTAAVRGLSDTLLVTDLEWWIRTMVIVVYNEQLEQQLEQPTVRTTNYGCNSSHGHYRMVVLTVGCYITPDSNHQFYYG